MKNAVSKALSEIWIINASDNTDENNGIIDQTIEDISEKYFKTMCEDYKSLEGRKRKPDFIIIGAKKGTEHNTFSR